jgi:hypothetical protein
VNFVGSHDVSRTLPTVEKRRSERYERKSMIITSNFLFSEWDRIFKDPMTAAAIDRLVHDSVILEMTGTSVRAETAEQTRKEGSTTTTTTATTRCENVVVVGHSRHR